MSIGVVPLFSLSPIVLLLPLPSFEPIPSFLSINEMFSSFKNYAKPINYMDTLIEMSFRSQGHTRDVSKKQMVANLPKSFDQKTPFKKETNNNLTFRTSTQKISTMIFMFQ